MLLKLWLEFSFQVSNCTSRFNQIHFIIYSDISCQIRECRIVICYAYCYHSAMFNLCALIKFFNNFWNVQMTSICNMIASTGTTCSHLGKAYQCNVAIQIWVMTPDTSRLNGVRANLWYPQKCAIRCRKLHIFFSLLRHTYILYEHLIRTGFWGVGFFSRRTPHTDTDDLVDDRKRYDIHHVLNAPLPPLADAMCTRTDTFPTHCCCRFSVCVCLLCVECVCFFVGGVYTIWSNFRAT